MTRTKAYAVTRLCQRMTPYTNSKMPRGYLRVNRMANQASTTTTIVAISRNISTMKSGMAGNRPSAVLFTEARDRFYGPIFTLTISGTI